MGFSFGFGKLEGTCDILVEISRNQWNKWVWQERAELQIVVGMLYEVREGKVSNALDQTLQNIKI